MVYTKNEVDDECLECAHYHYTRAHISMDAYNDYPEECDCDKNWECPYHDCDEDCDACDVATNCDQYVGGPDDD